MRPDAQRVYFLHLPKVAGLTLREYLEQQYAVDEVCPAQFWDDLLLIPTAELDRYRLFRGHFGSALLTYLRGPVRVLTMVRDPVERAWSHFRFAQRIVEHPFHEIAARHAPDLASFARHPEGARLVSNLQARQLGIDELPERMFELAETRWREPRNPGEALFDALPAPLPDDELLDHARRRLDSCDVVGLVERFDESARLVAYTMGWDPPGLLQHVNAAPDRSRAREALSPGVVEAVLEANQLDVAVVDYARARFERDRAAMDDTLLAERSDRSLRERSAVLTGTYEIGFGEPFRGSGWGFRQVNARGAVRWSGPGTESWLDVPVVTPAGSRVEILVVAAMNERIVDALEVDVNGAPVPITLAGGDAAVLYSGVVGAPPDRPYTRVVVRTPETVPWNTSRPDMYSDASVGVAVAWVRLIATP